MADSLLQEIRRKFKPRKKNSHKGDFGKVLILAGSRKYSGAAYLAGLACLRSGAGLVTLAVPDIIHAIVARRQPELIVTPLPATKEGSLAIKGFRKILQLGQFHDVLAVGPGLSQNPETQRLIRKILQKTTQPVVLDADGLNAYVHSREKIKDLKNRAILTPHSGEFSRLFGKKIFENDAARKSLALQAARHYGVVMVLKGHHTVMADPSGKVYLNRTGNPGMATAGTGDVLTGMIAALLGQGLSLWDAARFGVYLHGLAGDLAAKKKGTVSLMAGDLMEFLPQVFKFSK